MILLELAPRARRGAAVLALALVLAGAGAGSVARAGTARAAGRVPAAEIQHALREAAEDRDFRWRSAGSGLPETSEGVVARFFDDVAKGTIRAGRWIARKIGRLAEKIGNMFGGGEPAPEARERDLSWLGPVQELLATLLALVASVVALVFWRTRRSGARSSGPAAISVPAVPDLSIEDSEAGDVPVDRWLERAGELARGGELRLAARGLYLACLSLLAERELLTLARFKSNRDYVNELRRRSRGRQEVGGPFADNVVIFERVWYGRHETTEEMVRVLTANLQRMRSHA